MSGLSSKYNGKFRYVFLAMAVFAVSLLGGCDATQPQAVRFGLSSAVVSLDPRFATDATSSRINRLIYRQLVDFNDKYEPIPDLAVWQKLTPFHYRFTLRQPRQQFANGTQLTAHDVKATYDSILTADSTSPHRASLAMIRDIAVISDDQLDFLLHHADPLFPGRLVVGIMPASRLQAAGEQPVGNGSFQLEQWEGDERLRLKRVQDGLQVDFIRVPNPTVRVLKLVRGELDMFQGNVPPELIGWLQKQDGISVQRTGGSNFTYLGFNMDDPLTGLPAFRQAVAHAIDRHTIIRYVMTAGAREANALLTPDHWAGHASLPAYGYDPRRARELLAGLGFDKRKRPQLVYKTSNDPFRIRLATIIQSQLADVGIDVEIKSYDWGTFYGDIKAGRFQMYSLSWVGIKMPDIFRYVFASDSVPPAGANRGRYHNREVDELIDQAEKNPDLAQQASLYRQVQEIIHADLPYVPLWYEDQVVVSRQSVSGYTLASDGNYDGLAMVRKDRP